MPIVVRSAEYVRGYFDGEGCVHYESKPKPWGRSGTLIIATSDLDVMASLVETARAWDIAYSYHVYPPRGKGNGTSVISGPSSARERRLCSRGFGR